MSELIERLREWADEPIRDYMDHVQRADTLMREAAEAKLASLPALPAETRKKALEEAADEFARHTFKASTDGEKCAHCGHNWRNTKFHLTLGESDNPYARIRALAEEVRK